jgi:uncharacterized membrane protein
MHKFILQTFLKGFSLLIPVAVSIQVVLWLGKTAEGALSSIIVEAVGEKSYIPGMGVVLLFTLAFLTGLLMYPWMTRALVSTLEKQLRKIPVFGSVYSPVKDLMDLLGGEMGDKLGQPVMVTIPNTNMDTLGFITRESGNGMPEGFIPEGHLVVYVQWSSQIGGYCFVVPKDSVRPVNISVEDGMKWALTAGLSGPNDKKESSKE